MIGRYLHCLVDMYSTKNAFITGLKQNECVLCVIMRSRETCSFLCRQTKPKKAMSHVLKFGGTSMRHATESVVARIRGIHCQKQCPIVVVVVSAFAGVTNMLLEGILRE